MQITREEFDMGYPTYTIATICYIEAHVKERKMDYAELERQIGFSKAHIRDLFQRDTGYPLVQYVRMRKIKRSAFELINTDLSILDIAYRYGFSNPETYTRAFQKVTGMTPSNFRKKRPIVGKQELATGVYSIEILECKEQRSDIVMDKNICKNNESTILYGVPRVGYGCYEGNTPYPMCLKACSEYLGEDFGYHYSMVSSGAAFRLAWNNEDWDLSNVDIYHTFEESNEVYKLGAKSLGREFSFLGRDKDTTKEEFISFIKSHIDEGYPCIALGIIGPPEACIITGYRKNGEELLGWNFFQNDQEFAKSVAFDECGYFINSTWWENSDTQAVMCMGPIIGEKISSEQILFNAVKALEGRQDMGYSKGIDAYDAWKKALTEERSFQVGDNYSVLFEKLLCHLDAITCLTDGRGNAAKFVQELAKIQEEHELYDKVSKAFQKVVEAMQEMQGFIGSWADADGMLKNLASEEIRRKSAELIDVAKSADIEALECIRKMVK